ncbi:AbiJ-related protein [Actinacidiphila glaucinigra]
MARTTPPPVSPTSPAVIRTPAPTPPGPTPTTCSAARSPLPTRDEARHVIRFRDDWSTKELFERLGAFEAPHARFGCFLEGLASALPDERTQRRFVDLANRHAGSRRSPRPCRRRSRSSRRLARQSSCPRCSPATSPAAGCPHVSPMMLRPRWRCTSNASAQS